MAKVAKFQTQGPYKGKWVITEERPAPDYGRRVWTANSSASRGVDNIRNERQQYISPHGPTGKSILAAIERAQAEETWQKRASR